jgi:hypothetical protein
LEGTNQPLSIAESRSFTECCSAPLLLSASAPEAEADLLHSIAQDNSLEQVGSYDSIFVEMQFCTDSVKYKRQGRKMVLHLLVEPMSQMLKNASPVCVAVKSTPVCDGQRRRDRTAVASTHGLGDWSSVEAYCAASLHMVSSHAMMFKRRNNLGSYGNASCDRRAPQYGDDIISWLTAPSSRRGALCWFCSLPDSRYHLQRDWLIIRCSHVTEP